MVSCHLSFKLFWLTQESLSLAGFLRVSWTSEAVNRKWLKLYEHQMLRHSQPNTVMWTHDSILFHVWIMSACSEILARIWENFDHHPPHSSPAPSDGSSSWTHPKKADHVHSWFRWSRVGEVDNPWNAAKSNTNTLIPPLWMIQGLLKPPVPGKQQSMSAPRQSNQLQENQGRWHSTYISYIYLIIFGPRTCWVLFDPE